MIVSEKELVREYWEERPCGSQAAGSDWGSVAFFDEIEEHRYRTEPFIRDFAEFSNWAGKRVLEVGIGSATDFVNFARAGAIVTGVDLTAAAIELARRRLSLEGLGGDLQVADAEKLPFPESSFDLVYSWGVLHHTPDTGAAVREVRRVLSVGGEARVMLYGSHSWTGLRIWIQNALLRGRPFRSLSDVWANDMESPGTKAYTLDEIRGLFADFGDVTIRRFRTPYDEKGFGPVARVTGDRFGCFVGVTAFRTS
jgi:ubiquinone/menaquinone biosynthesis C-methylase UbiE